MKANSLALRLFITAAVWVLVVLPVAGWIIFTGYRERVIATFEDQIWDLVDRITESADSEGAPDRIVTSNMGRSARANAAWRWQIYWQIKPLDAKPGETLHSLSLGDENLPLPREKGVQPDGEEEEYEEYWADLVGPDKDLVRVFERIHTFGVGAAARRYSIAAAGRLSQAEDDVTAFRDQLILSLALAGVGLLAATLFQVRFGLYPLSRVEQDLAAIRSGQAARLEGELPAEIQPLQQELNALLKSNQQIVERARMHVGNLAHALKTPLAVIINEARRDPSPLARKVMEQADTMTAQVNLYLDRARMAARIGVIGRVTQVGPVAESLVRALDRLYRDKELSYSLDCPDDLRFQGERHDLEEMLGNLLDNASKWARSKVGVTAAAVNLPAAGGHPAGNWLEIRVDDDGPGLTVDQLAAPITRGRRLDEAKPGSGLGHSIVADLAYCYNGKFELARSEVGGLSARITLPLAA